ncbi:hypothetical protein LCGC14_1016760 [marine sediment metagenome]|uniref:ATP-cone domain-containing protein n=1 Tax=marine sediment metagenome TaxID=412755 RepID=A0A0F9QGV9_9ZZZZ
MNNLIPFVLRKNFKKEKFEQKKIYDSLIHETNITQENAMRITEQVTRYLISIGSKIELITAPMIREFVCVALLSKGLELERLQYTRIGFPKHDLNKLYEEYPDGIKDKLIVEHVDKEFKDVNILIKKKMKKLNNDI